MTFTNAAALNLNKKLKQELNINTETYTFHKLALKILKDNNCTYEIADSMLLEDIIKEFFTIDILNNEILLKKVCKYTKIHIAEYEQKISSKEIIMLEKLCKTFIKLLKCNNYELKDFLIFLKTIKKTIIYYKYKREKILLTILLNIYLKYQNYLLFHNEIDFDDMISFATKIVQQQGFNKKIKYIIIDEYQDTSYIRFKLVKEIINKTSAKLMVVGDDYQSIYGFSGCDLELFLNFSKYFPNAKIMKLERTYRNSQSLIEIAGCFIMKNKNQIKKSLYSDKKNKNPIKFITYVDIREEFINIIEILSKEKVSKILVLGRNNYDINMLLSQKIKLKGKDKIEVKKYEFLDITYMTVHKSKGLESDNVIIINLINKKDGFPNKVQDEKITRLVTKKQDLYPHSEERRLFYVALTRTKNNVYLLIPKQNSSIFVKELKTIINKIEKR